MYYYVWLEKHYPTNARIIFIYAVPRESILY